MNGAMQAAKLGALRGSIPEAAESCGFLLKSGRYFARLIYYLYFSLGGEGAVVLG